MTATSKWLNKAIGVAFLYRTIPSSVGFTLCVGVIFTIASCAILWNWEKENRQQQLQQQADNLAIALQDSILDNKNVLQTIKDFYIASREVEAQEFQILAQNTLARNPSVQAIGWAPRVTQGDRQSYETAFARARPAPTAAGLTKFEILEQDQQGILVRAKQRPEYFPVAYIEPEENRQLAIGMDLASQTTRQSQLEKAQNSSEIVASELIELENKQPGFLIFLPVYRSQGSYITPNQMRNFATANRENLKGFVIGVFRVADVLKRSLPVVDLARINFCVYDQSDNPQKRLVVFSETLRAVPTRTSTVREAPNNIKLDSESTCTGSDQQWQNARDMYRTLNVGGRQWSVVVRPTVEYMASQKQWRTLTALASGIVWMSIPMSILLIYRGRTSWIRQLVKKLSQANAELSQANVEIKMLNQLSDLLQACLTIEEAYIVIPPLVEHLFPGHSGGVFTIGASKNVVEATTTWGTLSASQKLFAPEECLALRCGQAYGVADTGGGLLCQHVQRGERPAEYVCVPMAAHGEILGVLYLSSHQQGKLTEAKHLLAVMVARQIAQALANLRLRETLKNQSIRDPLTNLFNRRYMEESLEREVRRAQRSLSPIGIIMIDIDHFKKFNDTFGHDAGDMVLRELAMFLQGHIRGSDIACRYGGEEFTLILPGASLEVTQQRGQQLRDGVKSLNLQYRRQSIGAITLSLGVASWPEHGKSGVEAIRAADAALYLAKSEGRDRVVTASSADSLPL